MGLSVPQGYEEPLDAIPHELDVLAQLHTFERGENPPLADPPFACI
ncbi:MAG: hypothetical protein QXR28_03035 [Nitrososphaerota archaeon]